eukprot:6698963-Pyramimonas_sp.AAC.1
MLHPHSKCYRQSAKARAPVSRARRAQTNTSPLGTQTNALSFRYEKLQSSPAAESKQEAQLLQICPAGTLMHCYAFMHVHA